MNTERKKFITEEEKLALNLQRSYTERFYMLMRLIKISRKINAARIANEKQ